MNNGRKPLYIITAVSLVSLFTCVALLNVNVGGAFYRGISNENSYSFTINSSDINNQYTYTPSGTKIEFETNNVSVISNNIQIDIGGYLRLKTPINGTTSISASIISDSDDDRVLLSSGYKYNDYGAAIYLTRNSQSANMYNRTYFQFSCDNNPITISSISVNYSCAANYEFTPIMDNVTENLSVGAHHYNGLRYQDNIEPNWNMVDLVEDRFDLVLDANSDPVYSIHPVAKFYDKGGCLIKQVEGFWLVHVNPIIRFFTAKDKFEVFSFTYGDSFDQTLLRQGVLGGFDWSEYTKNNGVLTKPLTQSMDLYPKVVINVNPGAYSSDVYNSIVFTPNPNTEYYGFPDIPAPNSVSEFYHFGYWLNGDERYDRTTASDFHDYDLYAEYTSDFDLRLRFINRGFTDPYFEKGIPNGGSFLMPPEEGNGDSNEGAYVDQTTAGLSLGYNIPTYSAIGVKKGYLVYPEGHRDQGVFYEAGVDTFYNDGKGTSSNPTRYVAEPYTFHRPIDDFNYISLSIDASMYDRKIITRSINDYKEHMWYDGKNDVRTYFKKIIIPDSTDNASTPMIDLGIITCNKNICNANELEVVVGNSIFDEISSDSFQNNIALKRLEYFPSLTTIKERAFRNCPNLEPLQNWTGVNNITSIGLRAFEGCYINPIIDSNGNISRRTVRLPSSVKFVYDCAFAKTIYTDFYLNKASLTGNKPITKLSFAYNNDGSHSVDFQNALNAYNSASASDKQLLEGQLKAVANRLYFNGSKAEFETFIGESYNEINFLCSYEYYVVFAN